MGVVVSGMVGERQKYCNFIAGAAHRSCRKAEALGIAFPLPFPRRCIFRPAAAFPDGPFPSPFFRFLAFTHSVIAPIASIAFTKKRTGSCYTLTGLVYKSFDDFQQDLTFQAVFPIDKASFSRRSPAKDAYIGVNGWLVGKPQANGDGHGCDTHLTKMWIVVEFGDVETQFREYFRKSYGNLCAESRHALENWPELTNGISLGGFLP